MKKRLIAVMGLALGLAILPSVGATAVTTSSSTWGCVIVEHVDLGICQGNPLPNLPRLPL